VFIFINNFYYPIVSMTDWINNLYLINTVINIISTSFTLLFVLYRFTSLFSYFIGFIKFCGKLYHGLFYLKDRLFTSENNTETLQYSVNNDENTSPQEDSDIFSFEENNSFFSRMKSKIYKWVFPKKKEYTILPTYEIRTSYIEQGNPQQIENEIITNQIRDLIYYDNESDSKSDTNESIPLLWVTNSNDDISNGFNNNNNNNSSNNYSNNSSSSSSSNYLNGCNMFDPLYNNISRHNNNSNSDVFSDTTSSSITNHFPFYKNKNEDECIIDLDKHSLDLIQKFGELSLKQKSL